MHDRECESQLPPPPQPPCDCLSPITCGDSSSSGNGGDCRRTNGPVVGGRMKMMRKRSRGPSISIRGASPEMAGVDHDDGDGSEGEGGGCGCRIAAVEACPRSPKDAVACHPRARRRHHRRRQSSSSAAMGLLVLTALLASPSPTRYPSSSLSALWTGVAAAADAAPALQRTTKRGRRKAGKRRRGADGGRERPLPQRRVRAAKREVSYPDGHPLDRHRLLLEQDFPERRRQEQDEPWSTREGRRRESDGAEEPRTGSEGPSPGDGDRRRWQLQYEDDRATNPNPEADFLARFLDTIGAEGEGGLRDSTAARATDITDNASEDNTMPVALPQATEDFLSGSGTRLWSVVVGASNPSSIADADEGVAAKRPLLDRSRKSDGHQDDPRSLMGRKGRNHKNIRTKHGREKLPDPSGLVGDTAPAAETLLAAQDEEDAHQEIETAGDKAAAKAAAAHHADRGRPDRDPVTEGIVGGAKGGGRDRGSGSEDGGYAIEGVDKGQGGGAAGNATAKPQVDYTLSEKTEHQPSPTVEGAEGGLDGGGAGGGLGTGGAEIVTGVVDTEDEEDFEDVGPGGGGGVEDKNDTSDTSGTPSFGGAESGPPGPTVLDPSVGTEDEKGTDFVEGGDGDGDGSHGGGDEGQKGGAQDQDAIIILGPAHPHRPYQPDSHPIPLTSPTYHPLRIRAVLTEAEARHLTPSQRSYLLERVLHPAMEVWSTSLKVVPVRGALTIDKEQLYDGRSCGPGLDSGLPSVLVPEEHFENGVEGTDLVVYVSVSFRRKMDEDYDEDEEEAEDKEDRAVVKAAYEEYEKEAQEQEQELEQEEGGEKPGKQDWEEEVKKQDSQDDSEEEADTDAWPASSPSGQPTFSASPTAFNFTFNIANGTVANGTAINDTSADDWPEPWPESLDDQEEESDSEPHPQPKPAPKPEPEPKQPPEPKARTCAHSSYLASAAYCSTDQHDRPVAGMIHLCLDPDEFFPPESALTLAKLEGDGGGTGGEEDTREQSKKREEEDEEDLERERDARRIRRKTLRALATRTCLHELGHVLGFNSQSLAHFRYPGTGEPRTERDGNGDVPDVEVECVGPAIEETEAATGSVGGASSPSPFANNAGGAGGGGNVTPRRHRRRAVVPLPSSSTLSFKERRGGVLVAEVATDTVARVVRNRFGCAELGGAELESGLGDGGRWGYHGEGEDVEEDEAKEEEKGAIEEEETKEKEEEVKEDSDAKKDSEEEKEDDIEDEGEDTEEEENEDERKKDEAEKDKEDEDEDEDEDESDEEGSDQDGQEEDEDTKKKNKDDKDEGDQEDKKSKEAEDIKEKDKDDRNEDNEGDTRSNEDEDERDDERNGSGAEDENVVDGSDEGNNGNNSTVGSDNESPEDDGNGDGTTKDAYGKDASQTEEGKDPTDPSRGSDTGNIGWRHGKVNTGDAPIEVERDGGHRAAAKTENEERSDLDDDDSYDHECIGNHLERRLFKNDVMNPIVDLEDAELPLRISSVTLAYFADSGWYLPEPSRAAFDGPGTWGRAAGCDFVEKKCITRAGKVTASNAQFFCSDVSSSVSRTELDDEGEAQGKASSLRSGGGGGGSAWIGTEIHGCTPDMTRKALCSAARYDAAAYGGAADDAIPAEYQYFNGVPDLGPGVGGSDPDLDFCPVYSGFANGLCAAVPSSANDVMSAEVLRVHHTEEFGVPNSRCVSGRIKGRSTALCLPIACVVRDQTLRVKVDGFWEICEYGGQMFPMWKGDFVICPDPRRTCPTFYCPRDCFGFEGGVCDYTTGKCMCPTKEKEAGSTAWKDSASGTEESEPAFIECGTGKSGDSVGYLGDGSGVSSASADESSYAVYYVDNADMLQDKSRDILTETQRAFERMTRGEVFGLTASILLVLLSVGLGMSFVYQFGKRRRNGRGGAALSLPLRRRRQPPRGRMARTRDRTVDDDIPVSPSSSLAARIRPPFALPRVLPPPSTFRQSSSVFRSRDGDLFVSHTGRRLGGLRRGGDRRRHDRHHGDRDGSDGSFRGRKDKVVASMLVHLRVHDPRVLRRLRRERRRRMLRERMRRIREAGGEGASGSDNAANLRLAPATLDKKGEVSEEGKSGGLFCADAAFSVEEGERVVRRSELPPLPPGGPGGENGRVVAVVGAYFLDDIQHDGDDESLHGTDVSELVTNATLVESSSVDTCSSECYDEEEARERGIGGRGGLGEEEDHHPPQSSSSSLPLFPPLDEVIGGSGDSEQRHHAYGLNAVASTVRRRVRREKPSVRRRNQLPGGRSSSSSRSRSRGRWSRREGMGFGNQFDHV